jgi:hypothetical protein
MARSERQVPSVYFGRPGALVTLPWPRGDLGKPYERLTSDFVTGTGQHAVQQGPLGSRSYAVNWNALHQDTYSLIEQYVTGNMGMGPWAFLDPSAPNLLLPNQASATNNTYDLAGLATSTGLASAGTLLSNTDATAIHRTGATRSIRWQFVSAASGSPTLVFGSPYRNWYGIPVFPGLSYAWSTWMKPDGIVDSAITMSARIQWLDAAGSQLSESTSGDFTPGTWLRFSAIAAAPAGAAYARPVIVSTSATITTGASIYVYEPLFEQDSVANAWAPGTGVRAVEILSMAETVPFAARFRTSLALNLRELAS